MIPKKFFIEIDVFVRTQGVSEEIPDWITSESKCLNVHTVDITDFVSEDEKLKFVEAKESEQ